MKFASSKIKKFVMRATIVVFAFTCFLVFTLSYADRTDGEELMWMSVKFRQEVGRWPQSSDELYERATPDLQAELQHYTSHGFWFSNQGKEKSSRILRVWVHGPYGIPTFWTVRDDDYRGFLARGYPRKCFNR